MEHLKHKDRFIRHLVSAPFIYSAFIGFVVLDIFVEMYHRICFPLYGLELIDRKKYIKFERHKLHYISWLDKVNCAYCSYGNGLIGYVKEITAQTEIYWCGIKNPHEEGFVEPEHHKNFAPYGDQRAFQEKYGEAQKDCKLFQ